MKIAPSLVVVSLALSAVGSLTVACSSQDTEDVGTTSATLTARCGRPGMTRPEILACIKRLTDESEDLEYCEKGYNCVDFTNTFCDTARSLDVACLGLGVWCADGGGHAVAIVYLGNKCFVVEPQDGTIIGEYPPVNGSCNTYSSNIPHAVCRSVDSGAAVSSAVMREYIEKSGEVDAVPVSPPPGGTAHP